MALDQAYIDQIADEDFTPELEESLFNKLGERATKYLTTKKGLLVKSKEQDENDKKAAIDEFAKSDSPRYYKTVEIMLTALGSDYVKPQGKSVAEWVDSLSKAGKLPFSTEQIKTLEESLKAKGATNTQAQAIIDDLKKQIDEKNKSDDEKEQKRQTNIVNRDIKSSLNGLNYSIDPGLKTEKEKSDAKAEAKDIIETIFNAKYKGKLDENEDITYYDKDDKPLMNTDTQKPLSVAEIIQKNHAKLLSPAGHQQQGGGTGPNGGGGNNPPARTKEDVLDEARKKGLSVNSPEWKKFRDEEFAKLPK